MWSKTTLFWYINKYIKQIDRDKYVEYYKCLRTAIVNLEVRNKKSSKK